jgi:mannose-6-phosphate isomerase-like protein (cupin superfamily)
MAGHPSEQNVLQPKVAPVRRVVTGHNDEGRALVVSDGACPHVDCILGQDDHATTEIWVTSIPANNNVEGDPVVLPHRIQPPEGSAVFRIVEFPPDETFRAALRPDQKLIQDDSHANDSPMMHRTRSTDYVVIMAGELVCVMEEGEVLMRPGDVMVQRGTNHEWQNRTNEPARAAFVMIDALPLSEPS